MLESIVPRAVGTLEKTGATSSDAKKLRGKAGSRVGGFRGGVIEAGPPQGRKVVAAIPGITSRHHHVQNKEKAIFRSEEAFPETP